jgi:orotidine-5'-phosphate decarboxylase
MAAVAKRPTRPSNDRSAPIPARERLIVALDVPTASAAQALVTRLGSAVIFYKIGLELAMSRDYFALMDWLLARDKRVFADLKLHDIPNTVAAAVRNLSDSGASFLTVHCERSVVEAAAANKGNKLRILGVTVLTSISEEDLRRSGIEHSVAELAVLRARAAISAGCDGVIASGHEAADLRAELGQKPLIVTPGIRPADAGRDDQKRTVTARTALESGADYIVVGRPIRDAADPAAAASALQAEIAAVYR